MTILSIPITSAQSHALSTKADKYYRVRFYGEANCQTGQNGYVDGLYWNRNGRGWVYNTPGSPEHLIPLEAAADMFLNWVYRTNRNGVTPIVGYFTNGETAPSNGCVPLANQTLNGQIVETWAGGGFYNRAPNDNQAITAASFDWSLSGDIRHALMRDILNDIFSTQGW